VCRIRPWSLPTRTTSSSQGIDLPTGDWESEPVYSGIRRIEGIWAAPAARSIEEEMSVTSKIFEVQQSGENLIVTPLKDLSELDYEQIQLGARDLLELLSISPVKNVVMDFRNTDSFGSTALGFFVKLWKKIRQRNGYMAFCNLSENEKEILQVTKLDGLWPMCGTLDEALKSAGG
jgi:anti-anti-sigma factor